MRERPAELERDARLTVPDDAAKHVCEAARGLTRPVLVAQALPERPEGLAELGHEQVGDLAHRLRLARELGQVVPVAHLTPAEAHTTMLDALAGADHRDRVRPDAGRALEPGPARRHRVVATLDPHQRARRDERGLAAVVCGTCAVQDGRTATGCALSASAAPTRTRGKSENELAADASSTSCAWLKKGSLGRLRFDRAMILD